MGAPAAMAAIFVIFGSLTDGVVAYDPIDRNAFALAVKDERPSGVMDFFRTLSAIGDTNDKTGYPFFREFSFCFKGKCWFNIYIGKNYSIFLHPRFRDGKIRNIPLYGLEIFRLKPRGRIINL